MYLLEHDAKTLLAAHGIPVPAGVLATRDEPLPALPPGPWMIKAQIQAGGRGKAGGVLRAASSKNMASVMAAGQIGGRLVREWRIERQVCGAHEAYLSLMIDPCAAGVRVLLAARGGMDIEAMASEPGLLRAAVCGPDPAAAAAALRNLAADLSPPLAEAMSEAGPALARAFFKFECTLLEINPLFVMPDGRWICGDAKMIADDNALERQPALREMLERRAPAYPEAHLKAQYGCDYVVVDPEGEIGLLTTGAGLSMMLIDELREAGLRPYNFLDVRTGGLRGDPARLIHVLEWIAQGARIKVVLVNIFAGITDLGEFSRLLLQALQAVPQLKVPVVARLVGNALESAREVLRPANIEVVTELGDAVARVRAHLA